MTKKLLHSTGGKMRSDRLDQSFKQYTPPPKPKCDCISYNGQAPGQTGTPEAVIDVPDWVGSERQTVCIDACIVDHIKALWGARIWTLSCCCGHNGRFPRHVVVDQSDHAAAQTVLDERGADMQVMSWQLCGTARAIAEGKE